MANVSYWASFCSDVFLPTKTRPRTIATLEFTIKRCPFRGVVSVNFTKLHKISQNWHFFTFPHKFFTAGKNRFPIKNCHSTKHKRIISGITRDDAAATEVYCFLPLRCLLLYYAFGRPDWPRRTFYRAEALGMRQPAVRSEALTVLPGLQWRTCPSPNVKLSFGMLFRQALIHTVTLPLCVSNFSSAHLDVLSKIITNLENWLIEYFTMYSHKCVCVC